MGRKAFFFPKKKCIKAAGVNAAKAAWLTDLKHCAVPRNKSLVYHLYFASPKAAMPSHINGQQKEAKEKMQPPHPSPSPLYLKGIS